MTNLIETIENGNFNNLGKPDRIIETLISKLFFFTDDVYKVYKYNKAFFGDFSDKTFRDNFYNDDFIWNNTMSPDIYLKIGYVKNNNNSFEETTREFAEDYYILMKKIDDTQTLFNLIKNNKITKENLELITEQMFLRTQKLTQIKKSDMKDFFNTSYIDLDLRNLGTTREWMKMAPDLISESEADSIIDILKEFVKTNSYFKYFNTDDYLNSIDNHSGNILFYNNEVNFIDSMPPMDIWRVQSDAYSISRPATDLEVLVGKEYSDIMYKKFEEVRNTKIDSKVRIYFQVTAALIQAPYMTALNETEYAQKFWEFAKEKAIELK